MNRVEFMETLSRLLQDIPEEDRIDALKYYNDYFDDAGSENEQNVIEELESPEKVAMKIKADREDTDQYYQEDTYGEEKDNKIYQDNGTYDYESQEKKPWTNKWLKLAMIIAIVVIAIGVIGTVVGVRLCIIVFPGIVRGIVYILRKPFHRKAVA